MLLVSLPETSVTFKAPYVITDIHNEFFSNIYTLDKAHVCAITTLAECK